MSSSWRTIRNWKESNDNLKEYIYLEHHLQKHCAKYRIIYGMLDSTIEHNVNAISFCVLPRAVILITFFPYPYSTSPTNVTPILPLRARISSCTLIILNKRAANLSQTSINTRNQRVVSSSLPHTTNNMKINLPAKAPLISLMSKLHTADPTRPFVLVVNVA